MSGPDVQESPMVDVALREEIAEGVHVILDDRVEFVPNVGLIVGDRAVLVIDTAMGHDNGETILAAAREAAAGRKIILTTTHFHPEHAFGAKPFEADVVYVANASQAAELEEKGDEFVELFSGFGPGLARLLKGVDLIAPDVTYRDRLRLDLGGTVVELIEVGPAHTKGDQLIFLPDRRILFAGDLVEHAFFPILPDDDADGSWWLEALAEIEALEPAIVVGGHGAVGGPELVAAVRAYLELVRDRTAALLADEEDPDAIAAKVAAEAVDRFEGWGNDFWIKSAVESFARPRRPKPPRVG